MVGVATDRAYSGGGKGVLSIARVAIPSSRSLSSLPWEGDAPAGWGQGNGLPASRHFPLTRAFHKDMPPTEAVVQVVHNWLLDIPIPGPMN
jgi:hypothetical protein